MEYLDAEYRTLSAGDVVLISYYVDIDAIKVVIICCALREIYKQNADARCKDTVDQMPKERRRNGAMGKYWKAGIGCGRNVEVPRTKDKIAASLPKGDEQRMSLSSDC
jgi:hypothetical protein